MRGAISICLILLATVANATSKTPAAMPPIYMPVVKFPPETRLPPGATPPYMPRTPEPKPPGKGDWIRPPVDVIKNPGYCKANDSCVVRGKPWS